MKKMNKTSEMSNEQILFWVLVIIVIAAFVCAFVVYPNMQRQLQELQIGGIGPAFVGPFFY
ncbi:hypothetical protein KKA23_00635 [Patescibacteria group bacterium]|nr:hypothetical protein [Patescibacteria group bacterium]